MMRGVMRAEQCYVRYSTVLDVSMSITYRYIKPNPY